MIYKNDEAFNFETIEDNKMTNEEIKQLWIESGKTLIVEGKFSFCNEWAELSCPAFTDPEGYYRFKDGQDFSVINDKAKKEWEDSGKSLIIQYASDDGSWKHYFPSNDNPSFFKDTIYRIKPEQEITWDGAIGECDKKDKYTSADAITEACEQIKNMLLNKNRKYGDSALNPMRVFSKANASEQLKVRMDDKLSRIQSAQSDDLEDAMLDLTGYLVLDIARKLMEEKGV